MKTKRLWIMLLCTLLCGSMAGCGGKASSNGSSASSHAPAATAAEEPAKSSAETEYGDINTHAIDLNAGPATILPRLQKAYNGQDLYAIVECFDPAGANAFFGMAKLLGFEADALQSVMPFFSTALGASGALDNSSWGTVTLTAKNYEIDGVDATLFYNVSLKMDDGSVNSFDETLDCVLVDDVWYISLTQPTNIMTPAEVGPIPVHDDITETDVARLYTFKENGAVGILNQSAKVIIDPFFQAVGSLDYDYIPIQKNNAWGIMDRMGNLVVDYQFQDIRIEEGHADGDGYFEVKHNDKWGLFNVTTGRSIPCIYDDIGEFSGGVAPAKLDGFWGVIDENGNTVAEFIYDSVKTEYGKMYMNGLLGVEFNRCFAVIDAHGETYIPFGDPITDGTNNVVIFENFVICGWNNCAGISGLRIDRFFSRQSNEYVDIPQIDDYGHSGLDVFECSDGSVIINLRSRHPLLYDGKGSARYDKKGNILWTNQYTVESVFDKDGTLFLVNTKSPSSSRYNLMREDGSLVFTNNYYRIYQANDFIFAVEEGQSTTIYDYNFNMIDNIPYPPIGIVANPDAKGIYFLSESGPRAYFDFSTGEITELSFSNYEYYEIEYNDQKCFPMFFVVGDGAFKGLISGDEFVGSGIKYHSVSYDYNSKIFTLQLGDNEEHYRIGYDGTIVQLP